MNGPRRASLPVFAACIAPLVLCSAIAHADVACPADLTDDNVVDVDDLLALINIWGSVKSDPADLNASGEVDVDDLLILINAWGDCPPDVTPGPPTPTDLAGRTLTQYPYFEFGLSFNAGSTVHLALDPFLHPDLAGATADIYVVADKTADQWTADATLLDIRASGLQTVSFAGADVQSNTFIIDAGTLSGAAGTGAGVGYDVIIDSDQNGLLNEGDLIDGADGAGLYIVHDLAAAGPYATSSINYSGGSFLAQRTYYPTNIADLGQLPLVIISHGNGMQYTWYNFLQSHLASYGYVVMSHQNNTQPGIESASTTTLTNTTYILNNLATIAGGALNGHIDNHKIIWMGHSRGGEGIVRAYDRIFDGTYVPSNFVLSDIVLLSSIAPTDFLGTISANPHSAPYHLIYGSSDGDVCGCPNNDVADSFNLYERALGTRVSTYVHGADHNDFNCCGVNDFQGPAGTAIGSVQAQQVLKAVDLALIKFTLEGNLAAKDYLWRQWESLRPIGVSASTVVVNDLRNAVGTPGDLIIEDYQHNPSTAISGSGGGVAFDVLNISEGKSNDNNTAFTWAATDPMNGMVRCRTSDTSNSTVFNFNSPATPSFMEFEVIPSLADWSGKAFLSLRAAQGTRHPDTTAELGNLTFVVKLRDINGVTSAINIGAYGGGIEEPYQRTGFGTGAGWQDEFEVIRIRLGDFLANGSNLDLTNIVAIRLEFGGPGASARGRISLDDIMVTAQ